MKPDEIEIGDIKAMLHGKVSTPIITISSSNSSTPTDNDATSTNTTVLAPVRKRSRWDT